MARVTLDRLVVAAMAAALGLTTGCKAKTVGLDDLPCGNDACLYGYVCHPETARCVPTIRVGCATAADVCATTTNTGDDCPSAGSFLPCSVDVQDCAHGCRTCSDDLTWSECSMPPCDTCITYYRDEDADGVGRSDDSVCQCGPTAPYTATTGGDCDDSPTTGAACSTGCVTTYTDGDLDGLGDPASPVTACTAAAGTVANADDCNDGLPNCGLSCTDGDNDGYCLGVDCDDDDNACTSDCSACPPTTFDLTIANPGAIAAADTVNLEIDMGTYARDASSEITCTATPQTIEGPFDFTQPFNLGNAGWQLSHGSTQTVPTAPFDKSSCNGAGDYLRMDSHNSAALQTNPSFDATGWRDLTLYFRAAVEDGYGTGDNLVTQGCCGTGCNRSDLVTTLPASIGGTNACSLVQASLPYDDCRNVSIRIDWGSYGVRVGVDDLRIDAVHIVPAVTISGFGTYTIDFPAAVAGSFDVTCTWRNDAIGSPLSDTVTVAVTP